MILSPRGLLKEYVKADQIQTYIKNKILYLKFHLIYSPYLCSLSLKNSGFNLVSESKSFHVD